MTYDETILKNFGLNLKIYRSQQNVSQEYISKKTGLSKSFISNVEQGKHNLSFLSALKFANALNKNLSDMIKSR